MRDFPLHLTAPGFELVTDFHHRRMCQWETRERPKGQAQTNDRDQREEHPDHEKYMFRLMALERHIESCAAQDEARCPSSQCHTAFHDPRCRGRKHAFTALAGSEFIEVNDVRY